MINRTNARAFVGVLLLAGLFCLTTHPRNAAAQENQTSVAHHAPESVTDTLEVNETDLLSA